MDRLAEMFNTQRKLMKKYHDVEVGSGLTLDVDIPVDLNDPKGQQKLRDIAWRFTEEIGEALNESYGGQEFHYEIIDSLHFLIELTISSGINIFVIKNPYIYGDTLDFFSRVAGNRYPNHTGGRPSPTPSTESDVDHVFTDILRKLGALMNLLKNKAWKQSLVDTDRVKFSNSLFKLWYSFIHLCDMTGLDCNDIYELYNKKHDTNIKRLGDKY